MKTWRQRKRIKNYKYKGEVFIPFEMLKTVTLYYMLNDLAGVDGIPKKEAATILVELIKDELKKRRHGSDDEKVQAFR